MAADRWVTSSLVGPARRAFVITPADAADFANFTRAIYVGVAGNINVRLAGDTAATVLFSNVPAGTVLPIAVAGVESTSTTASLLIGMF